MQTCRKRREIKMKEKIQIELNKIKEVLCALWDNTNHPEAEAIVKKFKEELDEIEKGN